MSDHQLLWLDDNERPAPAPMSDEQRVKALEQELQQARKDLSEVRKDLAAKTVALSKKEQVVAQEVAVSVSQERERQMQTFLDQIQQLEAAYASKQEELEEMRRSFVSQKRSLKQALAAASDDQAQSSADEAASALVATQAMAEELESLHQQLSAITTRHRLEVEAKEAEAAALRAELAASGARTKVAVAQAEAALSEALSREVAKCREEAGLRVREMELELSALREAAAEARQDAAAGAGGGGGGGRLAAELAELNNSKIRIQREFESFKEVATAASRQNREEIARLLDENAALRSKLAKQTVDSIGGPGSGGGGRRGAKQRAGGSSHSGDKGGGFYDDDASGSSSSVLAFAANAYDYEKYLPAPLLALDRRRRGLVPALFIAFLVCLIFVIAVLRAALSARGEHRGLCFLAKLGVNIGAGCGKGGSGADKVVEELGTQLGHVLDKVERVHDVPVETVVAAAAGGAAQAAAAAGGTAATKAAAQAAAVRRLFGFDWMG